MGIRRDRTGSCVGFRSTSEVSVDYALGSWSADSKVPGHSTSYCRDCHLVFARWTVSRRNTS
jgi:hypothetical protein